jgi:hypothetical protein
MYRSEAGGPLVPKVFSRESPIGNGPLFRDGDTTYWASPSLYAWDEKTDRVESLTLNLSPPLDKKSYVDHAFARGASLLIHVKYPNADGLFFSADRGRSWRALERPVPDASVNGFAPSDNGVVVATNAGVWLLPLQR